ncbi:response regulator [Pontibacter kalidii]|uniref:response regulator n=1 Tax=Pontibacter kalidii TaxID=2592049 RepID=UPI00225A1883|nr:response regulator [Pontibacter kalidii]
MYIIDDDEVSAFLTEAMLATEHFARKYESFRNPGKALQCLLPLLQQNEHHKIPDVIFLDLNMPCMDGWEFLDALSLHAPSIKSCSLLYVLTSSVDFHDVRRAQKYDFLAGFLQKPLEEETIRNLLHKA